MQTMKQIVIHFARTVLSIHKYPRYIVDLSTEIVRKPIWRRRGVRLATGDVWLGVPIITVSPDSSIEIGEHCLFCSRSSQTALGVNHPVVLRTLRSRATIRIGSGVRMSGTTICAARSVIIGDRCVIGANATIVDTDFHSIDPLDRASQVDADLASCREVLIGDDVFIGGGSYILKGVRIGNGAVIGAGSVVTKDVPPLAIVAGNPARVVGTVQKRRA